MKNHVKITTFGSVMDWICPYKCRGCGKIGKALCGCCIFYIRQQNARFSHEFFGGKLFVGGMREGLLSRCLIDFKYNSVRGLAEGLAEILSGVVPEGLGDEATGVECGKLEGSEEEFGVEVDLGQSEIEVVVVPLPTIARHIRERGFDHTRLLAEELAKKRGWKCERILVRKNKTVQVGADAEMRKRQAGEAYGVDEALLRRVGRDKVFLLVDDIYTTGASMEAAEAAMRRAGVERIFKAVVAMNRCIEDDAEVGDD